MKRREEMIRDVHRRIREYEAVRKKKRTRAAVAAVSVLPLCGAAVLFTVLLKGGALSPSAPTVLIPPETPQVAGETVTSGSTEETVLTAAPAATEAVYAEVTEAPEEENVEVTEAVQAEESAVITATESDNEVPEEPDTAPAGDTHVNETTAHAEEPAVNTDRPLIASYPSSGSESMSAPMPGHKGIAGHLYQAKEEYRDTADYHVKADIFTESGQVSDAGIIQAEAERFLSMGYDVTVESEPVQTGGGYYYLAFVMTYEQLEDFPVPDEYGYAFRLYDYDC